MRPLRSQWVWGHDNLPKYKLYNYIYIFIFSRKDQNGHVGMFWLMLIPLNFGLLGWHHGDGWDDVQAIRKDHVLQAASAEKHPWHGEKTWGESIWIYLNLWYMWNMETVSSKEMIMDGSFLLLCSTSYALREQTGRSTTSVESRAAIAWLWLSACELHKTMGTKSWEGTVENHGKGQWFSIPSGNST